MRKSLAIFCLGCVIGAASVGGVFAYLWQKAETARKEAEESIRQLHEERRRVDAERDAALDTRTESLKAALAQQEQNLKRD